ncbi:MAG: beta-propeller fold lactonase family protein [Chthonomonadales bacterium]|nr:beta-propeller fold lactonase family protein [Chthonomonadales bacterium]
MRRWLAVLAAGAAAALLAGCGGNDAYSPTVVGGGASFDLAVSPATRTVAPGQPATYSVTLTAVKGFASQVALSVTGLPSGATAHFAPAAATPTSGGVTSTLTVTAGDVPRSGAVARSGRVRAATPDGSYPLTVRGTGGGVTREAAVTLVVQSGGAPSFSIGVSPAARTVAQGEQAIYSVTLTAINGFSSAVPLQVSGLPSGATAVVSPASVVPTVAGAAGTLTVSTASSTPVAAFTLTIGGSAAGVSQMAQVALTVTSGGGPSLLNTPSALAFSPDGKRLYVTNQGGLGFGSPGFTAQYAVNADGSLTPLTPFSVPTGGSTSSIATLAGKTTAYVTSASDNLVYQFDIATGALTPLSPPNVSSITEYRVTTPNWIAADPLGRYVYTANGGNGVSAFAVGADGTLDSVGGMFAPAHTNGVAVRPDGQFVYAVGSQANPGGAIRAYRIEAGGSLTSVGTAGSGALIRNAIDSTGSYLYATESPAFGIGTVSAVQQYRINIDGTLTALSPASVAAGDSVYGIIAHPAAPYVYVTNAVASGTILQYRVSANGTLTPLSPASVAAGNTPVAIAVSPDGRWAYAANQLGNTITGYRVNANGTLTPLG